MQLYKRLILCCTANYFLQPVKSTKLFVAIKALPKSSLVEVQAVYHTGRFPVRDEDSGDVSLQEKALQIVQGMSIIQELGLQLIIHHRPSSYTVRLQAIL
jgi:hypothetical protein